MSDEPKYDPMAAWKSMRDANLEAWTKAMGEVVNSDAYNKSMTSFLDTYLTSSIPFQRLIEQSMTQVLSNLNMPTRSDVLSIAERLTNVEMRLDDLEAKLDQLAQAPKTRSTAKRAPIRTKK